jgi:ATP-dependent helicase HrpA
MSSGDELQTAVDWPDLERRLAGVLGSDRHRLRQRLGDLKTARAANKPIERNLARWLVEAEASTALRDRRARAVPTTIPFDERLPIAGRRAEIIEALRANQVLIVCGETGSGKSTQLPLICLEAGRGVDGIIGHTQPRRIAARSVAGRVAEELHVPLGKQVGFQVRFTDATAPETLIKLMTDGILLSECQTDRFLNRYDTLILDEAHERSLNIDFLIGTLTKLLPRRRDLKLIVTSATIDAARFSDHFQQRGISAPVLEVSGRSYPVDIQYRPPAVFDEDGDPDWSEAILQGLEEALTDGPGDVLVFLPTERDIFEMSKLLKKHPLLSFGGAGGKTELLPLYARLPTGEQQRVFAPHSGRRIVLATNVAESSLTVPGIRYVIDPGTARISRYSPRSKVQRLPVEPISQASANQRAGRCGRIGPGVCIRLYSRNDFEGRDRFTLPEIQRTNLAAIILRTLWLKLGRIEEFPFLDPPRPESIRDGFRELFELGAIDDRQELTPLGRRLAQLPVDPRIGRMILAADEEGCLHEMLIIAAVLELQDPRERPYDKQQAADTAHEEYLDETSDFLGLLKVWDAYHRLRDQLSRGKLQKACQQKFLSANRLREWVDLHQQLLRIVTEAGLKVRDRKNDPPSIARALVTGLVSNIAFRPEGNEYVVAGGGKCVLWPGSGLFASRPRWIVGAEQIETSRRYLRTVAEIDPGWVERLVPHLIQRAYFEPHWDRASQSAKAYEKVSLYGLVLVPKRRVQFGPVDPKQSRELFIRCALVDGDCDLKAPFFLHNHGLLKQLEDLQTRTRRGGLLLGPDAQFHFYDQRLPPDIYDVPRLEKWRKTIERETPQALFFRPEDICSSDVTPSDERGFPDRIQAGGLLLDLDYKFDPSADNDGITLKIPPAALNQLDARRLGWLVPGLLEEKVMAVLRSLPKAIRVRFVPIPDTARKVLPELSFGVGDFPHALSLGIARATGIEVPASVIEGVDLPKHLRIHIAVVDERGKPLATGQNLEELRAAWAHAAGSTFDELGARHPVWHREGVTDWDFGDIPPEVPLRSGNLVLKGYVALVDTRSAVRLKLVDTPEKAKRESRGGVRRLMALACKKELFRQLDWFPDFDKFLAIAMTLPDKGQSFRDDIAVLLAERACLQKDVLPRSQAEFKAHWKAGRERFGEAVQEIVSLLRPLLLGVQETRPVIESLGSPLWQEARLDMKEQLAHLVAPGFLTNVPFAWLVQFPRYLQAMRIRATKLKAGGLERDRECLEKARFQWREYSARLTAHDRRGVIDPELQGIRWLIEEYRVSLFAQDLKTAVPVSDKRLEEQWRRVLPAG